MCVFVLSHFSCVQLCVTLWTVACQASLSMGFSREEYWSGQPCLPSGDLPDSGIEPASLFVVFILQCFSIFLTFLSFLSWWLRWLRISCNAGDPGSISCFGKIPRRKWHLTPVFLSGESHGQRSLVGYRS